jgi:DNA adenine methylase
MTVLNEDYKKIFELYGHREDVLMYCDPPYLDADQYGTGWTEDSRYELIDLMKKARCKVLLSGYETDSYDEMLGWGKIYLGDFPVAALKGEMVAEYLWHNYDRY